MRGPDVPAQTQNAPLPRFHWHRQDRTRAPPEKIDHHVDVVRGRIEEALENLAAIICAEPASAMFHGDEGIRRALAAQFRQPGHRKGSTQMAKRRSGGPNWHHHSKMSLDFKTFMRSRQQTGTIGSPSPRLIMSAKRSALNSNEGAHHPMPVACPKTRSTCCDTN
jgi:hypothetical protein